MPVQNRIVKVQKRNRALVKFDSDRIRKVILQAAESIGGFRTDFLPGVNDKIFSAQGSDENIAGFLADTAIVCLNSDPHHLISNFPPPIETIQDEVLHALRSYGFQNTADAYECYRWGRHWLREGALTPEKFSGNGFPLERMKQILDWNRRNGVDTVAGLNEAVRSGRIKEVIAASLAVYEASLDEAAQKGFVPPERRQPFADDVGERPEFLRQDHHHGQADATARKTGPPVFDAQSRRLFLVAGRASDRLDQRPELRNAGSAGHPVVESASPGAARRADD